MKTFLVIAASALVVLPALADHHEVKPAYKGSKEFEKLKSLVGTWTGKMKMDPKAPEMDMEVTYRLVAGGSVLEERTFPGTPMEMITMSHDKGGKLALTHYCMLGNQPALLLKSSDDKSISFDFDPSCSVDAKKETHMHSLTIKFLDAGTIEQAWTVYSDGKSTGSHPIKLTRVKK